jgi:ABC-type cobalt transport system substrate-binding protein
MIIILIIVIVIIIVISESINVANMNNRHRGSPAQQHDHCLTQIEVSYQQWCTITAGRITNDIQS